MPRFGAEDGGMYAQNRGEGMNPAQARRRDYWRERRWALREEMERRARQARQSGRSSFSVLDAVAASRRVAQQRLQASRRERARLEAERRRQLEIEANQRQWRQIMSADGYTSILPGTRPDDGQPFVGPVVDPNRPDDSYLASRRRASMEAYDEGETGRGYKDLVDSLLTVPEDDPSSDLLPITPERFRQARDEALNTPSDRYLQQRFEASRQNYSNFREFEKATSNKQVFGEKPEFDPSKSVRANVMDALPEPVRRYLSMYSEWTQQNGVADVSTPLPGTDGPGADGSLLGGILGTSNGAAGMQFPNLANQAFPWLLTRDEQGNWTIEHVSKVTQSYADLIASPQDAADIAMELAAGGYYSAAAEKRLQDRMRASGSAFALQWGDDDWDALEAALRDTSRLQALRIGGLLDSTTTEDDALAYEDILTERAMQGLGIERGTGAGGSGPRADGDINPIGSLPPGNYGGVELDEEQLRNADIIAAVGFEMGATNRDVMIGIMTAMQESSLRNVNYGDRDSLGLFQQRPSQGWGSPEQVTNPRYAAAKFFENLLGMEGRHQMAPTEAAQAVQRSAYPNAYAQWQPMAEAVMGLDGGQSGGSGDPMAAGLPDMSSAALPTLNADGTAGPPAESSLNGGSYNTPSTSSGGTSSSPAYNVGSGPGPSVQLSHPDTIKVVAESVAQQRVGRALTEDELASIVARVHQAERNDHTAAQVGATRTPPDLQAMVAMFIEEELGGEEELQQGAQFFDALVNMIRGADMSAFGG